MTTIVAGAEGHPALTTLLTRDASDFRLIDDLVDVRSS
jgi:hypothetical protein